MMFGQRILGGIETKDPSRKVALTNVTRRQYAHLIRSCLNSPFRH
jgi:hypothetical protein